MAENRTVPQVSVLIPTRNERDNIRLLTARLASALRGLGWELIFVDDSDDDTPACIREAEKAFGLNLRLIHRPPGSRQGGLGGAVLEGFAVARGAWVCVMDADLQHPPERIPGLLEKARQDSLDLVVASRMHRQDGLAGLSPGRSRLSTLLAWLTRAFFPGKLKKTSDPLTGFFIVRRAALRRELLSPDGFKVLLEILVRTPGLRVGELPFQIGRRHQGASKAGLLEMGRFLRLLGRLRIQASRHFLGFAAVGATGLFVNTALLFAFTELLGFHYLLSALLAVQGSTAWNFIFTDLLVFGKENNRRGSLTRWAGFFALNNLFFLLRGPILTSLVAFLGIHYLISNLISIAVATAIRYLVSSRWIWSKGGSMSTGTAHFYDIHGVIRVESGVPLPELSYFKVPELEGPADILVQIGNLSDPEPRKGDILYEERLGSLGFRLRIRRGERVDVAASPLIGKSPHVLYTNVVEPLLRWSLVARGYALIHGACISYDGKAALITARTDTGKTTTILKTLNLYAFSFLSDDMTILSADGRLYNFPKPLTISRHTLRAVDDARLNFKERLGLQVQSSLHSRLGRRAGFLLARLNLPVASLNALVQMLVPPPKYHISRLIPRVRTERTAQLCRVIVIARGKRRKVRLLKRKAEQILLENGEDAYSFPPYPQIATALRQLNGRDLAHYEQAIISRALHRVPADLIFDPNYQWWRRIPGLMTHSNDLKTQRVARKPIQVHVQQRKSAEI